MDLWQTTILTGCHNAPSCDQRRGADFVSAWAGPGQMFGDGRTTGEQAGRAALCASCVCSKEVGPGMGGARPKPRARVYSDAVFQRLSDRCRYGHCRNGISAGRPGRGDTSRPSLSNVSAAPGVWRPMPCSIGHRHCVARYAHSEQAFSPVPAPRDLGHDRGRVGGRPVVPLRSTALPRRSLRRPMRSVTAFSSCNSLDMPARCIGRTRSGDRNIFVSADMADQPGVRGQEFASAM